MAETTTNAADNLSILSHEPVPGVVACCEEMLARAKSGDLLSIAVAAQSRGASTSTAYDNSEGDVAYLVCALERLKLRLLTDD